MKIFVGNLLFDAVESDVERAFAAFGTVASVEIVKEKNGVRSRGFGFVEMPDQKQAEDAIAGLAGKEFMGRVLNVSPARPKSEEERQEEFKKRAQEKIAVRVQIRQRNDQVRKAQWATEGLAKTGGYKGGRRTRSFIRKLTQQAPAQAQRARPWETAAKPPRPWRKSHALQRARNKPETAAKTWRGASEPAPQPAKPWKKPEPSRKPWKKQEFSQKPLGGPELSARKSRQKTGVSVGGLRYTKEYVRPAHKQRGPKREASKARAKPGGPKR